MSSGTSRVYLTPLPVRIWHWLNALGIVSLMLTGIQIRFPEYVNIFGGYKTAIYLHDIAGILVTVSYGMWLIYYAILSRSIRQQYIPTRQDIKQGLLRQARFYFFDYFFGGENPHVPTPENKFNAIQKTSYFLIMFILLPITVATGLLLMNIAPLREWIIRIGGIKFLAEVHYLLACSFVAFLAVHIYMATLGHTLFGHFWQMLTGWEETEKGEDKNG